MRVLYVEDNPGDAKLLHYQFAEHAPSMVVEWAATYTEAVARLSRCTPDSPQYDLVLTDMNLPDGNGISLAAFLRERGLSLPLVVITGLGDEDSAVSALRAGASDYVVKRDDYLVHLPGTLEMALRRHQTERARHASPLHVIYGEDDGQVFAATRKHFNLYASYVLLEPARSGREILERLSLAAMDRDGGKDKAGQPCDVLLLDYQLADMTAIELLKEVRGVRRLDMPIVVISGEGNQEIAVQALRLGADDYLAKNRGYLYQLPNVLENAFNRVQVERERAALKASEEYFRTLIENASDLILVVDADTIARYCSPSLERILGYKPEAFIGKDPAEHIHPEDVGETLERTAEIIRHPGVTFGPFFIRLRHKDGTWRHTEAFAKSAGSPGQGRVIINSRDITERRKMEEALQESEAKYRGLVESSLVGVFVVHDGSFQFVNQRLCEIYGYPCDELVGRAVIDFVHPDDHGIITDMRHQIDQQGRVEGEFRVVRKDGKAVEVKVLVSPLSYRGCLATAGTMIDITRERVLEHQLHHAQKMEALGTMAGGIAHDFNNILTALTGYGSLLKMAIDQGTPVRAAHVEAMLAAALKGASLNQSLLDFARQQPISLHPLNLNELVAGTEKLLKRLLTEDIAFRTELSPEEMTVLADHTQIDQILFNLAVNARDAMPTGGTISLETAVVEVDGLFAEAYGLAKPGRYARLSITDTGMGMDEATSNHIFEPFFTTKEAGKGTGLGLSTVYGIVKQHDGCITVSSEKNIGTTFRIYLPLAAWERAEKQAPIQAVGGTETLLLAEDDEAVRELMTTVLSEHGYTVIKAVDGDEAVALFNTHHPIDLLILDSVMPRKNGRQAYDDISSVRPGIKVIFTSGYTKDVVLDKGIEEKQFDFIAKPVSIETLLRTVREVLDR